ncbi:MAG: right-handed parallel beta-helix repeat-containing protein [Bacteroidales bacterium]|nr:right-handed parallel beta-helix repeat-containing protein [Bacteroidales bacterium]
MKRSLILAAILLPLFFVACDQDPLTENDKTENTDPDQPENPEDPATPEDPENPDGPDQPDGPDTPEDPENPDQPEGPEDPENPDQPDDPENPENPDLPDDPVLPEPPVTGSVELDRLYGYAAGTTGGEGGKVHHFDDGAKFCEWLKAREKNKSTEPAVVWLSGTFTASQGRDGGSPWFDIKRTHNISIYGTDGFKMQNVGFFLNEASNIVIRNVYIVQPKADNGADGISMQESHDVWVDHCTFESVNQTKDYEDGSCDVTHQTYNVTVSWCHFIKTQKSCLVGHSNSATADEKITVTFHHNFFDRSNSRHPRVRFGKAHVYNNFFNGCDTYGVGSAYNAKVLVEYNLFDGVRLPIDICTYPAKKSGSSWVSNLTGSVAGYVYERDNEFLNRPSDATDPYPFTNLEYTKYNGEKLVSPLTFEDFRPSYDYVVDPASDLAVIVPSSSGVGKLPGFAKAPIEVDNGGLGTSEGGGDGTQDGEDDPGTDTPPSEELGNGWSATACGGKTASATVSGGRLTVTANGKFESGAQSFGYVYIKVSGDFTATARVVSFEVAKDSNQGLAGILVTPDISKEGTDFLHGMSAMSKTGYYYSYRLASGEKVKKGEMPSPQSGGSEVVVCVTRQGSELITSYSLDGGATFGGEKKNTVSGLPDTVYLGLAANSADNSKSATAVFTDFVLNGETIPF